VTDIVRVIEAYESGEVPQIERKFGGKLSVGPISKTAHTCDGYGPTSFGGGQPAFPNSGSGDLVGEGIFIFGTRVIAVPSGYQSGTPLVDSATYLDANFATLGMTPGTYVYTWSSDSFTVEIGPTAVPEPASLALLGGSLLGLIGLLRWRHGRTVR
jgi:hypothetical protein